MEIKKETGLSCFMIIKYSITVFKVQFDLVRISNENINQSKSVS